MKKIIPFLIVFVCGAFSLNAQKNSDSDIAFRYIGENENIVISLDLKKIREWADLSHFVDKIPNKEKDEVIDLLISYGKMDGQYGVDFEGKLLITMDASTNAGIYVPLNDSKKLMKAFKKNTLKKVAVNNQRKTNYYYKYNSSGELLLFNHEILYVALGAVPMEYELEAIIQQLENNWQKNDFFSIPYTKEAFHDGTGIDSWRNPSFINITEEKMQEQLVNLNLFFDGFMMNSLWNHYITHSFFDNQGLHIRYIYNGDEEDFSLFLYDNQVEKFTDKDLIQHTGRNPQYIGFANLKSFRKKMLESTNAFIQYSGQLQNIFAENPGVFCNNEDNNAYIMQYNTPDNFDEIIQGAAQDWSDAVEGENIWGSWIKNRHHQTNIAKYEKEGAIIYYLTDTLEFDYGFIEQEVVIEEPVEENEDFTPSPEEPAVEIEEPVVEIVETVEEIPVEWYENETERRPILEIAFVLKDGYLYMGKDTSDWEDFFHTGALNDIQQKAIDNCHEWIYLNGALPGLQFITGIEDTKVSSSCKDKTQYIDITIPDNGKNSLSRLLNLFYNNEVEDDENIDSFDERMDNLKY